MIKQFITTAEHYFQEGRDANDNEAKSAALDPNHPVAMVMSMVQELSDERDDMLQTTLREQKEERTECDEDINGTAMYITLAQDSIKKTLLEKSALVGEPPTDALVVEYLV